MKYEIPQVEFAVIGGSGTLSSDFPLGAKAGDVEILADGLIFATPYGESPAFRLFSVGGKKVFNNENARLAQRCIARRRFKTDLLDFQRSGRKEIIAEGGVGTVNPLLDPRDFLIPDDYLDLSVRKDVGLEGRYLLIMRDALCAETRRELIRHTKAHFDGRIFTRGTYAVTDGRHFESPAEIAMMKGHADIVGQSICPEVYLAREIGACYAGIYFAVNYGEGITKSWSHEVLENIFFDDAPMISRIILDTIRSLPPDGKCECKSLRKETLLKEIYDKENNG